MNLTCSQTARPKPSGLRAAPPPRLPRSVLVAAFLLAVVSGWPAGILSHDITLTPIGTYANGIYDDASASAVAHDPMTQRLFVVNSSAAIVEVLDITNPTQPTKVGTLANLGGTPNSVAVREGTVAVAVTAPIKTDPGTVQFYNAATLQLLSLVTVGSLPDMLMFTPNGRQVVVANEGEPSDDYTIDPLGTVSIINLRHRVADVTQADVATVDFTRFDHAVLDPSIRIFGPGASVSQDLEPEHLAISQDSRTAWVTLQENNAIARINLWTARVEALNGLGFKDHSLPGNALDASDKDKAINIANWPVKGIYEPDGIATFRWHGHDFLILANEGDTRDWDGFSEVARVKDLTVSPELQPYQANSALGRLQVTTENGYTIGADGSRVYTELYSFGGRSFSIRTAMGELVWDSGDQFDLLTAAAYPDWFNADFANLTRDDRSDNKGPEPEEVVVAHLFGRDYAFIGLERIGGILIYEVTNPFAARFVDYVNTRTFASPFDFPTAGDLGPEGMVVIKEEHSPTREPLLIVANEESGTVTLYRISTLHH